MRTTLVRFKLPETMKRCFKCGSVFALSEFYEHPKMPDGYLNKCKECTRNDVRLNRNKKLDYYRAYDKLRDGIPSRRKARYAAIKRYQDRYPEKKKAQRLVSNAIRDKRLFRCPCEICGTTESQAHHEDYSKPFEVKWLCIEHHNQTHRKYPTINK